MKYFPKYVFVFCVLMLLTFGVITADVTGPARTVQIVIKTIGSCAILISSMIIAVGNRYSPRDKYWAFTTAGAVLGYWLHV